MKNLFIITLLLLACTSQQSIDVVEVRSVIQNQQLAWNKGLINDFMDGYWNNAEMKFITKNGVRKGWNETLKSYKKSYPTKEKMGELLFTDLQIDAISQEIAHATGNWNINYPKDTIGGHFSLVFKQFRNGPKIIIDHTW